jgi:hypothetical protein
MSLARRIVSCAVALSLLGPASAFAGSGSLGSGSVSGTIIAVGGSSLTVQTHGRMLGVVNALSDGATALAARELPYVWGGGHAEAGVASAGVRGGPGANGKRVGYDCSGAVAAVLAAAGLWSPGSGVPSDAGVIAQLRAERLLAPGAGTGTGPSEVTLYDEPGVHIFMNIGGRFFGTSDGAGGGNLRGGAGWLDDGAPDASRPRFKRYHLLPSLLRDRTSYGHDYTFSLVSSPLLAAGAEPGERVTVAYAEARTGIISALALAYRGARTVSGTVRALGVGSFTLETSDGRTLTLATTLVPQLTVGLAVGDGVVLSYSPDPAGLLVPHALEVTSAPAPVAVSAAELSTR